MIKIDNKILIFLLFICYKITSQENTGSVFKQVQNLNVEKTLQNINLKNMTTVHEEAGTMPYAMIGLAGGFLDGMNKYNYFRQKQNFDFYTNPNVAKNITNRAKLMNIVKQPFMVTKYCLGGAYLGSTVLCFVGIIKNKDKVWESMKKHIYVFN